MLPHTAVGFGAQVIYSVETWLDYRFTQSINKTDKSKEEEEGIRPHTASLFVPVTW